jgi:hypothetical protein
LHAAENWRIDNCQIVMEKPRKAGNTTSGACGNRDSLEFHEKLTVSIADLELAKGMTCKGQETCISVKTTLWRAGERDASDSCTSNTASMTLDGSSEGVIPKQILAKAKSKEKSCLNLARDDASRAIAVRADEMQRRQARQMCEAQKQTCKAGCGPIKYWNGRSYVDNPNYNSCDYRCSQISCN